MKWARTYCTYFSFILSAVVTVLIHQCLDNNEKPVDSYRFILCIYLNAWFPIGTEPTHHRLKGWPCGTSGIRPDCSPHIGTLPGRTAWRRILPDCCRISGTWRNYYAADLAVNPAGLVAAHQYTPLGRTDWHPPDIPRLLPEPQLPESLLQIMLKLVRLSVADQDKWSQNGIRCLKLLNEFYRN